MLRVLPYSWSISLGAGLGALLWAASKKKVDEAERRCVKALQVGVTEARRIVRGSYMNLGRSVAEFLSMDKVRGDLRDLVEFHGEEHLREALARGKGVLFLSAHLGNWEIGAAAVAERGYPMNAIGTD
ncbi:MAG TPA: lipid A biosynthesis acyltransferase, partial [Aminivibrio sp.]|nr:lipid A biosynthesis acyltransferase [Aminivibrio sp.]